jgi:predicted CXXCH cytochrome family protein
VFTRSWTIRQWRVIGAGIVIAVILIGCNSQKRYDTLSFFFDGVPNPNSSTTKPGGQQANSNGRPIYVHQPFAQQKCDSCHQNAEDIFGKAKVKPNVCLDCHAAVITKHRYMHGPVVNNVCITCHTPHQSQVQHLLRNEAPKLCTQCHEQSGLGPYPPQHLEPKSACLSCHSGHGGNDHYFLVARQDAATTQPATRPATHEVKP